MRYLAFLGLIITLLSPLTANAASLSIAERLAGYVLLQVQDHGEAWYVNPDDGLRYYMADGPAAYDIMRSLSLGITNSDLALVPSVSEIDDVITRKSVCTTNALANRVKGYILLQVQSHGEAWYVDPVSCYRVYLENGDEAYRIMQSLSLGISNQDLSQIPAHADSELPWTPPVVLTPSIYNPFAGTALHPRYTAISAQLDARSELLQSEIETLEQIADEPIALWFGDWNNDIEQDVRDYVSEAVTNNALPVLVAYNIPNRDCGNGYSAGGVSGADEYHDWIVDLANGIGSEQAIVIIEPDALATNCFDSTRAAMLSDAVNVLEAKAGVATYLDAGHPNWVSVSDMADRLARSGVAMAQGFALNTANFYSTESNIEYGDDLSSRLNDKHYIIDTSRNGSGWQGEWCNPQGASIGQRPTTNTGHSNLDALIWVKTPGGSDGNCNGGPDAGDWWQEYAIKLIEQAD